MPGRHITLDTQLAMMPEINISVIPRSMLFFHITVAHSLIWPSAQNGPSGLWDCDVTRHVTKFEHAGWPAGWPVPPRHKGLKGLEAHKSSVNT